MPFVNSAVMVSEVPWKGADDLSSLTVDASDGIARNQMPDMQPCTVLTLCRQNADRRRAKPSSQQPYVEHSWRRKHKRQATHHTRRRCESSMESLRSPQNALHATLFTAARSGCKFPMQEQTWCMRRAASHQCVDAISLNNALS